MHLTLLDFAVLVAYLVGLALLGIFFSKRQTSEESYFLGNRRMPWLLVGVSVMATLISTLSYLALPGEMIRYGVGYFASLLAFVAVIPLVNRVILPALMRLPVTSVYEYFERRFSGNLRTLGATTFVLMRLIWVGVIIYTASFAVAEMTGWNTAWVIVVVGVVTTFYTTAGGMQAVVWSDFIQGLLLVGGAAFIPVYIGVLTHTGPTGWWEVFSQAGRAEVPLFSWNPMARITIVGIIIELFFWHACTHGADQVAAQRYLSTSSVDAARRSLWVSALFTVALVGLLMVVGLALFYFHFERSGLDVQQFQKQIAPDADRLLPAFIAKQLPAGLSGLLLAALLAAAMSSLSSGINSISSVVTTDFWERFRKEPAKPRGLGLAMIVALLAGVGGMGMALWVNASMQSGRWNLVELMERINHLFLGPLGGVFLAGVLLRRVGATAALLGFCAGVATSFLVSFSQTIFGLSRGISFMWIIPASFLATMLTAQLVGHLLPPPSATQLAALSGREEERG